MNVSVDLSIMTEATKIGYVYVKTCGVDGYVAIKISCECKVTCISCEVSIMDTSA